MPSPGVITDHDDMESDFVIIGAGVLGVSIAFWISELYDLSVCLIDKAERVASHTSSRNTGIVHRPFYLDPEKKKLFARTAQKSYSMWSQLAKKYGLPWKQVGTLELAIKDEDIDILNKYGKWAVENGMDESEFEVLDRAGVKALEPEVSAPGGILSKTDTSVDFGVFTEQIYTLSANNHVKFLNGCDVVHVIDDSNGVTIYYKEKGSKCIRSLHSRFMINAAGGGSLDIAHNLQLAKQYTDLHFRGEYRVVDENFGRKFSRNVYTVARYKEFPFLDPHMIMKADGRHEIGPNAVLVADPFAYKGLSSKRLNLLKKIFERPNTPKLKLFTNRRFLSLIWNEWQSSVSTKAMCNRVKVFIPSLDISYLREQGIAGVRSSLIESNGFVPEAILLHSENSMHILNYNSPGATGAPAFSAYIVKTLQEKGHLSRNVANARSAVWDFELASDFSVV